MFLFRKPVPVYSADCTVPAWCCTLQGHMYSVKYCKHRRVFSEYYANVLRTLREVNLRFPFFPSPSATKVRNEYTMLRILVKINAHDLFYNVMPD